MPSPFPRMDPYLEGHLWAAERMRDWREMEKR
jgi:hypothetical protein